MEVRGGRLGIQMGEFIAITPPLQFPILGADLTVEGGMGGRGGRSNENNRRKNTHASSDGRFKGTPCHPPFVKMPKKAERWDT